MGVISSSKHPPHPLEFLNGGGVAEKGPWLGLLESFAACSLCYHRISACSSEPDCSSLPSLMCRTVQHALPEGGEGERERTCFVECTVILYHTVRMQC